MASLVADYSSSGSSSNSETDDEDTEHPKNNKNVKSPSASLINPFRLSQSNLALTSSSSQFSTSIFANPFLEEENAKQLILEKHVKMTPNTENQSIINGRQVCWNYRKGRCRFGHNCKFAHDSDLMQGKTNTDSQSNTPSSFSSPALIHSQTEDDYAKKKKKRPGLSQTLIPSKRVMKEYMKQKQENLQAN